MAHKELLSTYQHTYLPTYLPTYLHTYANRTSTVKFNSSKLPNPASFVYFRQFPDTMTNIEQNLTLLKCKVMSLGFESGTADGRCRRIHSNKLFNDEKAKKPKWFFALPSSNLKQLICCGRQLLQWDQIWRYFATLAQFQKTWANFWGFI